MPTADVITANQGSVITITPVSTEARDWINFNCVAEPWQWLGGSMAVEPRCALDILHALIEDGFVLQDADTGLFAS